MKNAGKACNNRLYRHIRTFEKIVKNYFVIYYKSERESSRTLSTDYKFLSSGQVSSIILAQEYPIG